MGDTAGAIRAAHVHAAFAGSVSAQHGPILHEDNPGAAPGGGHGSAETGHASADHAEIGLMEDGSERGFRGGAFHQTFSWRTKRPSLY